MGHSTATNIPHCKAEFEKFKAQHPDLDTTSCVELFVRTIIAPSKPSPTRRRAVSDANGTQRSPATAQGRVRKATKQQSGTTMARGPSRQPAEMGRSATLGTAPATYTSHSASLSSMGVPIPSGLPVDRYQHPSAGFSLGPSTYDSSFAIPGGVMACGDLVTYMRTGSVPTPSIDIPLTRRQPAHHSVASSVDSLAALSSLGTSPSTPVDMSRNISNGSFTQGVQMMRLQSDGFSAVGPTASFLDDDDQLFPLTDLGGGFDGDFSKSTMCYIEWEQTTSHTSSQSSALSPTLDGTPEQRPAESPKRKREEHRDSESASDRSDQSPSSSVEHQPLAQLPAQRNPRRSSTYVRKPHPRVFCPQCPENKDGFRGEHEFRRHFDRIHAEVKKVWIVKDLSPDNRLSKCKACKSRKRYNTDYNATAHLRRQHFNPERDPKVTVPSNLREWVESVEVEPTEQEKAQWKIDDQKQRKLNNSSMLEMVDVDGSWQQSSGPTAIMMDQASTSLATNAVDAIFTAENIALQTWQELQYDGINVDDLTSFADNFQLGSFNDPPQDSFQMPIYSDFPDARLFTASGSSFVPETVDIVSMNTQVLRGGFPPNNPDDLTQWLS